MISNQILQSTIDGLKVISRIDLSVMDLEGNVLAATYPEAEEHHASVLSFVDSPADSQVVQGYQFFKIVRLSSSSWDKSRSSAVQSLSLTLAARRQVFPSFIVQ